MNQVRPSRLHTCTEACGFCRATERLAAIEARKGRAVAANPRGIVTDENCSGPNRHCRAAHKAGRRVHVIPPRQTMEEMETRGCLVLPTYHFATVADGLAAIETALDFAVTPESDEEWLALEAAHEVPFWTRPGLNHPTRR